MRFLGFARNDSIDEILRCAQNDINALVTFLLLTGSKQIFKQSFANSELISTFAFGKGRALEKGQKLYIEHFSLTGECSTFFSRMRTPRGNGPQSHPMAHLHHFIHPFHYGSYLNQVILGLKA